MHSAIFIKVKKLIASESSKILEKKRKELISRGDKIAL